MFEKIRTYILEHNMIAKEDRIVAGVSGGADSVCLFHVLLKLMPEYNLTLFAVHVNHGIRGQEADEDEAYVKQLCDSSGIPFYSVRADVPGIAKGEGMSEEEAGRKVRYEAFYKCFRENKCNKVAIAHNKNDNAETFLFHLFRGSGIKGLTGIQPVRNEIIRPLLCIGREEIEAYLNKNHIGFRTDSTNLAMDYSRNKIRHHIINFAQEEINSNAVGHIVNAAKHLEEINCYLEHNIKQAYNRAVTVYSGEKACEIDIRILNQEESIIQKGILRMAFEETAHKLKDLEALHINLMLALKNKEAGKRLNLPYGIIAVKTYHGIKLYEKEKKGSKGAKKPVSGSEKTGSLEDSVSSFEIRAPGTYYLPWTNQFLHLDIRNYENNMLIPKKCCTKWFDYDKIEDTVFVRTRQEGDFLQIDGKGSRKKIKALFIDNKIPRDRRDSIPLLADGAHILWVIGGRMSEAYKISRATKRILEIRIDGGNEDGRQD